MASEKIQLLTITGCVVPYRQGKPLVMNVPGSRRPHLSIFPSEGALQEAFEGVYDEVRTIEDGRHFLESLPPEYVVAYNPQKKGKCFHWLEVQRNWAEGG